MLYVNNGISESYWMIKDWADNDVFRGKKFDSFEDAEEFLGEFLDDNYKTDRQEYYIEQYED